MNESLKQDLLLDHLKPSLRVQVMSSIPSTVQQVIADAIYLEEKSAGVVQYRIRTEEQQRSNKQANSLERLNRSLDRITAALTTCYSEQEQHRAAPTEVEYLSTDRQKQQQRGCRRFWRCRKCPQEGHRADDCVYSVNSSGHATATLHSHACGTQSHSVSDCIPTTPEALEYANRLNSHTLKHHCIPTTPEALEYANRLDRQALKQQLCSRSSKSHGTAQTAGRPFAKCCTAVSGSDAELTEVKSAHMASAAPNTIPIATEHVLHCVQKHENREVAPNTVPNTVSAKEQACTDPSQLACGRTVAEVTKVVVDSDPKADSCKAKGKKHTQGYASPFAFTFSKPVARTKARAPPSPALGSAEQTPTVPAYQERRYRPMSQGHTKQNLRN